ncbi:MAG TPA: DNA recombination protein RmuC [Leptospiraceae bacterium]|nr:DNA recombination protein RmuC [Spirochaetaceae bacterium]HBS06086.1 DNA recombination protein RmuC [Leptospiraceae bacterium]|tara:strand:- start:65564 stop:66820 length:1257 start_codon:yes stop_codon:yes gene_type:complete
MELLSLFIGIVIGVFTGMLLGWLYANKRNSELKSALYEREVDLASLNRRILEEEKLRQDVEQRFGDAFRNLSQEIMNKHGEQLLRQNQQNIDNALGPLKERIRDFQEKVERSHQEAGERTVSLTERLKALESLGLQMSGEADRLTRALRGDNKVQGNWGEVVLERILEDSGLRKGKEYYTQGSTIAVSDENGKRVRPDVVIHLPEKKHLIIDSKVSLNSYEAYTAAETEEEKKSSLKNLIRSIRSHVDGLSARHYQGSTNLNTPDFVVLFMPVEASFSVALSEDSGLFQYAWNKRIMVVTPTTLMATLWTISSMWKQENQTRFALEIAAEGGRLYDKFASFVGTFEEVGRSIEKSQESYDRAMNQLKHGKGNLISRAEKIRKMGASNSRKLPDSMKQHLDGQEGTAEEIKENRSRRSA